MEFNIFRTDAGNPLRCLFDFVLEAVVVVLSVGFDRDLRSLTLIQPFIVGFHGSHAPRLLL